MAINLSELRAMIRVPLGVEEDELSDTRANLLLNRAFWEIMDKFPFREKEKTGHFDTQRGVRVYMMPPRFEYLNSLSISDYGLEYPPNLDDFDEICKSNQYKTFDWGQHKQLEQIHHNVYETLFNDNPRFRTKPRKYTRENCYAKVLPVPDKIYKITIKRNIVLEDLNDGDNNIPPIPQVWHEVIGYGGLWRAYISYGDLNRASHIKSHQVALINTIQPVEAKEEQANTQLAGLEAPGREY